jgi:predicted MFS family arabinose efflux permease
MGVGGALGGLVATRGFVALFLANAVTYVVYAAILTIAVREDPRPPRPTGGYRRLHADRPFVRLAVTNVAVIAVGWGVVTWIVPPYARTELGAGPQLLGLLLFANAVTVVLAQIPVARLAEGRCRAPTMALGSLLFTGACLLVLAGHPVALLAAAIIVGVGECLHTSALTPLVADLAPPALLGRYMATIGVSFWLGLALAPTLGAQLLSVSPTAALLVAAAVALVAARSALSLERTLPATARLTPRVIQTPPRCAMFTERSRKTET